MNTRNKAIVKAKKSVEDVEECERPARESKYRAFIETATSGKALRVPLNGKTANKIGSPFHAAARTCGMRAHYVTAPEGDAIIVWADKDDRVRADKDDRERK